MASVNENEIRSIADRLGLTKVAKWRLNDFKEIIGYLGDHLELIIEGESNGEKHEFHLFVKCLPRVDKWKADFLRESLFFYKEYVMINNLFAYFQNGEGREKWRPNTLLAREDLFVFENVTKLGYKMPHFEETMTLDALKATVKTVARFHAQSYIYEERKSKALGKPYRIWTEFSDYLQEPEMSRIWRDTGRNAIIDYLNTFSKFRFDPGFNERINEIIPKLFEEAMNLMKPSGKYRNVVMHRDLWGNNIFIKNDGTSEPYALLVDFQTVVYSSPMLDVSSLIYMNTLKSSRDANTPMIIDIYYNTLSEILKESDVDINTVLPKNVLMEAYNDSLVFGLTQASIIVPYTTISAKWKKAIFTDSDRSEKFNLVSRGKEFIEIANENPIYKHRVTEILDDLVEQFIYPVKSN